MAALQSIAALRQRAIELDEEMASRPVVISVMLSAAGDETQLQSTLARGLGPSLVAPNEGDSNERSFSQL